MSSVRCRPYCLSLSGLIDVLKIPNKTGIILNGVDWYFKTCDDLPGQPVEECRKTPGLTAGHRDIQVTVPLGLLGERPTAAVH